MIWKFFICFIFKGIIQNKDQILIFLIKKASFLKILKRKFFRAFLAQFSYEKIKKYDKSDKFKSISF